MNINMDEMCFAEKCHDNTCLRYQKHFVCHDHELHVGDRVKNKMSNKLGYIYSFNSLGIKKAITVLYDDNTMQKIFGKCCCMDFEKIVAPRNLSRTKYG